LWQRGNASRQHFLVWYRRPLSTGYLQSGIYEEDGALGEEPGYREYLNVPGVGFNTEFG